MSDAFLGEARPDWLALRDRIGAEVLERGFRPSLGTFVTSYDEDHLDAAALTLGLCGVVAPEDPRFLGTVEAVERGLRHGPIVYRYHSDDGLPGREGGFLLCAAWLAEAFLAVGRVDDARALFDDLCALAGPTGMMCEQWDPQDCRGLGNVPQAYSHVGV